jgi:thiamine-phosphate pyrophosphorylase
VTRPTRALKTLPKPPDWRLCFIADSEAAGDWDILRLISEAVQGGATLIQVRGKAWTTREFVRAGLEAALFLRPKQIPLIINDRIDIALACRAGGVHLGQEDLPLPLARRILGRRKLVGISVKTAEEARTAEKGGADYLGVGPVFPTLSKQSPGPFLGLEGIRRVRAAVKLPLLAIGGINTANAADLISAGADGVAVISAISSARDPRQAAAKLIEAVGKFRTRRRSSSR